MSGFQMIPEDMKAASKAAIEAAELARGHGSSWAVATAGEALPGSTFNLNLAPLGERWDKEIKDWACRVDSFGTALADQSAYFQSIDRVFYGMFGGLHDRDGRN